LSLPDTRTSWLWFWTSWFWFGLRDVAKPVDSSRTGIGPATIGVGTGVGVVLVSAILGTVFAARSGFAGAACAGTTGVGTVPSLAILARLVVADGAAGGALIATTFGTSGSSEAISGNRTSEAVADDEVSDTNGLTIATSTGSTVSTV